MQKQLKVLILFTCLLLVNTSWAQSGSVSGTVIEGNGTPVAFLNVSVLGTSVGAATDFDGKFTFNVEPGTYSILFSYVGYKNDTVQGVVVSSEETTTLDHTMGASAVDMTVFVVEAERNLERESLLILQRRESDVAVTAIGAEKLRETGASDAAAGAKKVVGLSVIGGRYVYVRGLGDRYNSAYLNGTPLPSPDPDAKVAPLDIFPTNVIRNLTVNKAFSPELYGDFSGGAIDIRTKTALKEGQLRVSFGGGANSISTFRNGRTYAGGSRDFWGLHDGTRALPAAFLTADPLSGDRNLPFRENFNSVENTLKPDVNFGLFGGTSVDVGEQSKLNFLITANYKNESRYRIGLNRIVNNQNIALIDYTVESYNFNTQSSALGTVNFELNKQNEVTFNSLWVNISSDQHRENFGDHFDYEDEVFARRYTFRENKVWVNQLQGEHGFGIADRLSIKWNVSYSTATSDEPDRRQLVYLFDEATGTYNFNAIDRIENHRWFSELLENEMSFGGSVEYRIKEIEVDDDFHSLLSVELGAQGKRKDRDFDYDIFAYRLENIVADNPGGVDVNAPDVHLDQTNFQNGTLFIQDVTGIEAEHFIRQDINAAYGAVKFDVLPQKLKILTGARIEDGNQRVIFRNNFDSEIDPFRIVTNATVDILPFFNLKYDMSDVNIIRASGSKTISRPGFREMAPFEYTEFFAGTKNVGNPNLVNGTNYNADVRFERFANPGELFAVGAFGKILQDPIEKVALASASGQLQSFRNTGRGEVFGLEVEYIKNLGGLLNVDSVSIWNDLSVGINATVLSSEIDLTDEVGADGAAQVSTNERRPLQGASPYLINADVSYKRTFSENLSGVVTLAYNVYGRRVFAAGENGLGDQYEQALQSLSLVVRADVGQKWSLNLKGSNLLDAEYRIEQETPEGVALINAYRTGVGISFGASYRLF